jgi:hypothetical protein
VNRFQARPVRGPQWRPEPPQSRWRTIARVIAALAFFVALGVDDVRW